MLSTENIARSTERHTMNESPLDKLIFLADRCDDFSAFRQAVAESIGVINAEHTVHFEFGSLKEFYHWARARRLAPQADPQGNNNTAASSLIEHPESLRLRQECERLRSLLEEAWCELQEIVVTILPNLKALYMMRLGSAEIELLQLRIETTRLKRTIELIQAHIYREKKPDLKNIEAQLEEELSEWMEKVNAQAEALRKARDRVTGTMSEAQTAAFKSLYRSLVKKLHPDLNPGQTDNEKSLWLKLQSAYERGDLEEMRLVEVLLGDCIQGEHLSQRSGIEEWEHMKNALEEKLRHIREKITEARLDFPYPLKDKLKDDSWVEEQNGNRRQQIQKEIALKQSLAAQLENIRRMLNLE
jgi:hypothetical protein